MRDKLLKAAKRIHYYLEGLGLTCSVNITTNGSISIFGSSFSVYVSEVSPLNTMLDTESNFKLQLSTNDIPETLLDTNPKVTTKYLSFNSLQDSSWRYILYEAIGKEILINFRPELIQSLSSYAVRKQHIDWMCKGI